MSAALAFSAPFLSREPPPSHRFTLTHPLPPCGRGWRVQRAGRGSAAQYPLGLDIKGVDRLARGHEQAVALLATETHVGAALGQQDAADHRAVGRVDGDPVLSRAAGPGAPDVAVRVDPQAIAAARL